MNKNISKDLKNTFKGISEREIVHMINSYSKSFDNKILLKTDREKKDKNYKFEYVDVANDYGFFRIEYDFYNVRGKRQIGAKAITIAPNKVMSTELDDRFLTTMFSIYLKMKSNYSKDIFCKEESEEFVK